MTETEANELIAEIENSPILYRETHQDESFTLGFQYNQERIKKIINRFAKKQAITTIYNYEDDGITIKKNDSIYGFVELQEGGIGVILALNNITEKTYADMVLTFAELKDLKNNIEKMLQWLEPV